MRKNVSSRRRRRFQETTIASSSLIPLHARPMQPGEALITVAEAARVLKVSRGLIYQMIRSGELAGIAIRRVVPVRASDLDRLIEAGRIGSEGNETAGGAKPDPRREEGRFARWKREHG